MLHGRGRTGADPAPSARTSAFGTAGGNALRRGAGKLFVSGHAGGNGKTGHRVRVDGDRRQQDAGRQAARLFPEHAVPQDEGSRHPVPQGVGDAVPSGVAAP